jgi:hypothetical protein
VRNVALGILLVAASGCAALPAKSTCAGSVELPVEFAGLFVPAEDEALLQSAKGAPGAGSLCKGKVYVAGNNSRLTLYRAWNSTNPGSRMGKWWAFYLPAGKVSQYRADYEICYEWSPLDKLTHCRLRPGAKVVVGTGQSARCSQYLTYPPSAAKQVFIEDSSTVLSDCTDYDLLFNWSAVVEEAK